MVLVVMVRIFYITLASWIGLVTVRCSSCGRVETLRGVVSHATHSLVYDVRSNRTACLSVDHSVTNAPFVPSQRWRMCKIFAKHNPNPNPNAILKGHTTTSNHTQS
jgi:hypothetical protein